MAITRAAHVRSELRDEVLWGVLPPGERLRVSQLASRFGVSSTVIREALTKLAADGFVELTPRLGFTVMNLSEEKFQDLTEIRVEVECLAIKMAIENGDVRWEAEVLAAHHRLAALPMLESETGQLSDAWRIAHGEFHRTIASACNSDTLMGIRARLWGLSEVYRIIAFSHFASPEARDRNASEHEGILEAILARDIALAQDRVRAHSGGSMRELVRGSEMFNNLQATSAEGRSMRPDGDSANEISARRGRS